MGALLKENDLAMVLRRETEPRLLSIQAPRVGAQRTTLKQGALFVDREGLDELAKHPALLVTASVVLSNLDARNVVNSLRGLMTDNASQAMLPAGDSNSIILIGSGTHILSLVRMLEDIDRRAGEARAARDAADLPAGAQGAGGGGASEEGSG